jgi:hypothetical protein
MKMFFQREQITKETLPLFIVLWLFMFCFVITLTIVTSYIFLKNENIYTKITSFGAPLHGVHTIPPAPQWSFKDTMNTAWQKQFESWVNERIPIRKFFIKAHNQILHSVFSKSYMYNGTVIVGKDNYLYENSYVAEYCNPNNKTASSQKFDQWATNLQLLADFFEKRGQKFVYLISPSKAAHYPEYIPDNYRCHQDALRPNYYKAIAKLKNVNFVYFDASDFLLQSKAHYADLLFPRGGIHWTNLAVALSLNEIFKNKPIDFSYTVAQRAGGFDVDLLKLENLLLPNTRFKVPEVSLKTPDASSGQKLSIIGGSFCHQIAQMLAKVKAFDQIDHHYYYSLSHFRYNSPEDVQDKPPQRAEMTFDDILSADVVILEENESNLDSNYLGYFVSNILSTQD